MLKRSPSTQGPRSMRDSISAKQSVMFCVTFFFIASMAASSSTQR